MKIKFADGTMKKCAAPIEQKIFRTSGGETTGAGWILNLKIIGEITSSELDRFLTSDNVSELKFFSEANADEVAELFVLNCYSKISSSVVRHAEDTSATYAEIQLSKGV